MKGRGTIITMLLGHQHFNYAGTCHTFRATTGDKEHRECNKDDLSMGPDIYLLESTFEYYEAVARYQEKIKLLNLKRNCDRIRLRQMQNCHTQPDWDKSESRDASKSCTLSEIGGWCCTNSKRLKMWLGKVKQSWRKMAARHCNLTAHAQRANTLAFSMEPMVSDYWLLELLQE